MYIPLSDFPLISLIFIVLTSASLLVWLFPDKQQAKWVALIAMSVALVFSIMMVAAFDSQNANFQFIEKHSWISTINVFYHVGVDGISLLFLPLTLLIGIASLVASWTKVSNMPRLFYTLLLLLETATIGVFSSLDTILFFMFWEMTLFPLFFLISFWGVEPARRLAAVRYILFMMAGGVALLFAFVLLALDHAEHQGHLVFDLVTLMENPVATELQIVVFFLLFLGFAPKIPVFPLHTWLPSIAMEGPMAVSALLTGLKLGAFGLIRFLIPLTPDAALKFHWLLAGIGVTGIIYGAILAYAQTNIRQMLAYASISHVGLVVLGIASLNLQGIQGSVFQLINFVIVSGGLFLLVGFLHHRTGTTDILGLGGVVNTMPLLTGFVLFLGLASLALPGTSGFPAEFLIIVSALDVHTGAGFAVIITMVLSAAYFLTIYRKIFLGKATSIVVIHAVDLKGRELAVAVIMSSMVVVLGSFPSLIIDLISQSTEAWAGLVSHP
ncbi:MAG: NADH-quinone oxidoreductase subunit M [Methylococcales bacterium]|nr:NADH-quinone oxidoreductase subunit M [Methylococcales bacterium]